MKPQDNYHYPPRGMDAERAAAYVGLSKSKFLELVDTGDAPAPLDLGGCPRWDRHKLDHWLDVAGGYVKKTTKTMSEVLEEVRRGKHQAEVRQQLQRSTRTPSPLFPKGWVA